MMDSAVINGIGIRFERRGAGPPLVLVHGLGGPAMWERVLPALSDRFDVILPHLPGFGETPPSGRPLAAEDHAAILAGILDGQGLSGVTVAGISYGGEIAGLLASSRRERVCSLVLICPTGSWRYPAMLRSRVVQNSIRPLVRAALGNSRIAERLSRRSFHNPAVRPPDLVARHLERLRQPGRIEALAAAVEEIWSGDCGLPGVIRGLPVPVTLVWGSDDRTVPPSGAEMLQAARPDAELAVIPECGHSVPLEKPEETVSIIVRASARAR